MARVATGAKHKIGFYWDAAIAGAPDIGVLLLIAAGLEDEDTLADRDTVAAILAATNDEATFTNYVRKTVSPAVVRDDAADTQTITLAGSPPLLIEWTNAGGAGGLGTNNVVGRLVYFYDPTPGSSTDAQKIHLANTAFRASTDGSTLRITIPPNGIATYRDGAADRPVSPTVALPPALSITNAMVAAAAGISLDKTADSATRLAMLAAERTKLGALAADGVTPDASVTNAKVAAAAAINLDKTVDSATRLAMTAAERTKLGALAASGARYRWVQARQEMTPDAATATAQGTVPDAVGALGLADAVTQGGYFTVAIPADAAAAQPLLLTLFWTPSVTVAASAVRWSINSLILAAAGVVSAAGTTVAFTGASGTKTAGQLTIDTATQILAAVSPGDLVRISVRRLGADALDTLNASEVRLIGARLTYTGS